MKFNKTKVGDFKTPEGQKINEQKTVNGTEIEVRWDSGYDDYTIYFPQIEIGEEAAERGVSDQVIRITRKDEVAKQVFDYATKLAETETDVYEIYKQVEEYAKTLPYDDEE